MKHGEVPTSFVVRANGHTDTTEDEIKQFVSKEAGPAAIIIGNGLALSSIVVVLKIFGGGHEICAANIQPGCSGPYTFMKAFKHVTIFEEKTQKHHVNLSRRPISISILKSIYNTIYLAKLHCNLPLPSYLFVFVRIFEFQNIL
ncbi:hypothetical protein Ahy_A02g005162 isoform D [Arachis hypogaea]|uniref:Uncharacterized protein n=1 Tax=Arachis hypogaea TaxID=3818 RepID=A0A445E5X9_ARAHY|nr:hypothetical protein Ahy_A02g005162 isoform D [Arachis hypogaea]